MLACSSRILLRRVVVFLLFLEENTFSTKCMIVGIIKKTLLIVGLRTVPTIPRNLIKGLL